MGKGKTFGGLGIGVVLSTVVPLKPFRSKALAEFAPRGGWTLVVKANGKTLVEKKIDKNSCTNGWTAVTVDLSPYAGQSVHLELQNRANSWSCEAGYWSRIAVQSE